MRTAPGIGFVYRPSRVLAVCAGSMAVLAIIALNLGAIDRAIAVPLSLGVVGYAGFELWRFLHPRLHALMWRADGGVTVTLHDHREVEATLHDARVFGPLIVLHLRWVAHGRAAPWVLPDNLDADTRRRLRVRLATDGPSGVSVNADSI